MENQVIKDQTLQGCHYVIIGFRALKLLPGHIESLYFVAINARDVGKIAQRTQKSSPDGPNWMCCLAGKSKGECGF